MQKKLLAAAVAGALAVPAAVSAQSTVQIYGQAEWEYGRIDQGRGRPDTDYLESTGSYLGFKGTENLGGGLTGWFQCETTMDIRAFDQVGLCSRNSGLGLQGGFGNIWAGRWHTPFSRIYGMGSPGQEETGLLGFSGIHGGSGSTSLIEQGSGNAGAINRQRFRRREAGLITYETPSFGGFQVGFAFSAGNAATPDGPTGAGAVDGTANQKPRLWSTAATYQGGPFGIGIGYQAHKQVGLYNTVGAREPTDRAWGASGRYGFGPVVLGMTYMERKWEGDISGDAKMRTWTIAAEWTIAGPHVVTAAYGVTGDAKGTFVNSVGFGGGAGSSGFTATGADTGYNTWTLAYQYNLSKRTSLKFGAARYDNDSNSRAHRSFNAGSLVLGAPNNGENLTNYALIMKHRF